MENHATDWGLIIDIGNCILSGGWIVDGSMTLSPEGMNLLLKSLAVIDHAAVIDENIMIV